MKDFMQTRSCAAVLALSLCWCGFGHCGETYEFQKSVEWAGQSEEELLAVPLDSDVFQATRLDYADLRLLNRADQFVPYLRQVATETKETTSRRDWNGNVTSATPLTSGDLEIYLKLEKDDPEPDGIEFQTSLENFEHRVLVSSSADGEKWKELVSDALIFDYSQFLDLRKLDVPFPRTADRYLRIRVSDITEVQASRLQELTRKLKDGQKIPVRERSIVEHRPFRIDGIQLWQEKTVTVAGTPRLQSYPVEMTLIKEDSEDQQTIIELKSQREPLTQFTLKTSNRNFRRSVTVQVRDARQVGQSWSDLKRGTISNFDFKDLQQTEMTIEFPESRAERYRLLIQNNDSPPLKLTGVEARGERIELICLADPGEQLRLAYGDPDAVAPIYDLATLHQLLKSGHVPKETTLGGASAGTLAADAGSSTWKKWLNHPAVLTGFIVLLTLVLGASLIRAARRIEAVTSAEGDSPPPV